jgi:chromosome segregation ATPase
MSCSSEDLTEDNQRLKRRLQESRAEHDQLVIEFNNLVDENIKILGKNEKLEGKYETSQQKIKELKQAKEELEEDIEDANHELKRERKNYKAQLKTKSQKITNLVLERDELQQRLSIKIQETVEARETLNDKFFRAKKGIADATRLDKQLGDETFRNCLDQIFERFRDCFLSAYRREPWSRFFSSFSEGPSTNSGCIQRSRLVRLK